MFGRVVDFVSIRQDLHRAHAQIASLRLENANLQRRAWSKLNEPDHGLSRSEVRDLVRLCHPDHHQGHPRALEITKKLTAMLREMKR